MTQYWGGGGGAQITFSYQFFIILKILGGASASPPPTQRSLSAVWFCQPDLAGCGSTRCITVGLYPVDQPVMVVVFTIFVVWTLVLV